MRPLFVLRPEPGATATAARAAAQGLHPVIHPLFAAAAVPWELPPGPFDGLLLTSAHAARLAGALPALPVQAVGEATAAAARAAGAEVVSVGKGGIDDLLRDLRGGLRLLHLTGAERIAPSQPRQTIVPVTVYRMQPQPPPSPEQLSEAVLLIHSPAAGRQIAELNVDRAQVRIAAISPAAALACGDGWAACLAAPVPGDAALLPLAAKLCKDMEP